MTKLSREQLLRVAVTYFNGVANDTKWSKNTRNKALTYKSHCLKELGQLVAQDYIRTYWEKVA